MPATNSNNQCVQRSFTSNIKNLNNKDLAHLLTYCDQRIVDRAALETVSRGEVMISHLIAFQGDTNTLSSRHYGDAIMDAQFPTAFNWPKSSVTRDGTALYLIYLIYLERKNYQPDIYLVSPINGNFPNRDEYNQAWTSVIKWLALVKSKGMIYARDQHIDPLHYSSMTFK